MKPLEESSVRKKADLIKELRCKNLIAVLKNLYGIHSIGAVIRNVNALGAEKVYVIDKSMRCQMTGRK